MFHSLPLCALRQRGCVSSGLGGPPVGQSFTWQDHLPKPYVQPPIGKMGKLRPTSKKTNHELSSIKAGSILSSTSWAWGWRCTMVRMVLRLTLDLPPACHDAPVVEKQIRSYDPASSTETTGHPLGLVLPAPPTTSTQVGQGMGFLFHVRKLKLEWKGGLTPRSG